ncbi:hypothetical protein PC116_g13906 [Phytophthora cactorum]|uniref:Uncharacterized protein n=1 Tax=Phytophthora cactorum TaxID=29920 RepID=A0A8T1KM84_9STRA|nr:hypothetical protein Pcac1_g2805 [Phytophthora cactorum]KAG2883564.1 hypothetical protein PC117_g25995 [Phytophthora cactorum]KAG2962828.1 hypothetical protein PC119_g25690 [Phytophthora cactorum]KAG3132278.1 hypothetical protein C6341_g22982 [Phytophthora cactorum]KAG3135521.1 hypothetical protein PC128_g26048 [Phytophthora cactorum]
MLHFGSSSVHLCCVLQQFDAGMPPALQLDPRQTPKDLAIVHRKYPAVPSDASPTVVVPSPALGQFAGTTGDDSFKLDLGLSLGHDSPCSDCYSSAGPSEASPVTVRLNLPLERRQPCH